ncbi:hypothetical protein NC653_029750 [Populus alba x Populus x berolinensis]|uniref:Uncharacterized protein n=1 Tax=Populus alba x Populus x berolinensis TaxID=444605 RepID=A0AAD6Q3V3_9ROSI|nr:hypothetical protein NC653_029750 [Populus alba x Populus x berolinensis]
MSGAGSAVEHHHRHHVTLPKMERNPNRNPNQTDCCNPVKKPGPVSIDHVLLALRETKEERDVRIRTLFIYFDAANLGYLDYAQMKPACRGSKYLPGINMPKSCWKFVMQIVMEGLIIRILGGIWMIKKWSCKGSFKLLMLNIMAAFCLRSYGMLLLRLFLVYRD